MAAAETGPRRLLGDRAVPFAAAASLLPDLDVLTRLTGFEPWVFQSHRLTHSFAGMAALSAAAGTAMAALCRDGRFLGWSALALAAGLLHLLLDTATAWGYPLWFPLSVERTTLALVPFPDPRLWTILAAGLAAGWFVPARRELAARASLTMLAVFLLFLAGNRSLARSQFAAALRRIGAAPTAVQAWPRSLSPFAWTGTAQSEAGGRFEGEVSSLRGMQGRVHEWFRAEVPGAAADTFVQAYERWAQVPVLRYVAGESATGRTPVPTPILFDLARIDADGYCFWSVRLEPMPGGAWVHRWLDRDGLTAPVPDREYELPGVPR